MRILANYHDRFHPGQFAVVINQVYVEPGQPKTYRCRLIRASDPNWIQNANTIRSISRTPGVIIYREFDVAADYMEMEETLNDIRNLITEAQLLSGFLEELHSFQRASK